MRHLAPDSPVRRGLDTARTIAPAGALLVAVAVGILFGYYYVPPVTRALDALADVKQRIGLPFAIVSTAMFGAVIPILVQQAMPATRTRTAWRRLPFFVLLWAARGVEVDLLYRLQAWMFGDDVALATIVCKVAFDQFVYCPTWGLTSTILAYMLPDAGYSPRKLWQELGPRWYRRRILPILVANWFVWIPAATVIYCVRLPLQLPIQNLVLCLWSILLLVVVRKPVTRVSQ